MCAKVAFMQLSSCWGCNQSLLNAHLSLLHVLPELEVVYWPAVVDFKLESLKGRPDKSVDVGFLEGLLRTEADVANAKLIRDKCKIVVALGSCPTYGSVAGMANLYPINDLIQRKFKDEQYNDSGRELPNQHVPKILDSIPDIHKVVKIDVDLPGCPPVPGHIVGLVATVLGEVGTKIDTSKSMCDVCPLKTCLLDEGKLCYGSITAVGENIGAIAKGYPVLGEFGLTAKINADKAAKLLNKMTANPMNRDEINKTVEALLMLIKGPVPLGFISGKNDVIRQTKLNPDNLTTKKIAHPTNLDKQIEVADFKIEGYPEIVSDIIGAALLELKNNSNYEDSARTVCTSCPNNVVDKEVIKYKRDYEGFPDPTKCLLVQGYVCFGPITKGGCGTLCPRANSPCLGCYGPSLNVDDFGTKAIGFFPSICRDDPENIKKFFKDPAGLFNRFTVPTSILGHQIKDTQQGGH